MRRLPVNDAITVLLENLKYKSAVVFRVFREFFSHNAPNLFFLRD